MAGVSVVFGLPSIAALRKDGARADTFCEVRDWAKGLARQGSLGEAGRSLTAEHRHAIVHFLWKESQAGPRAGRAKEVLNLVRGVPEFAVADEDKPWSAEAAASSLALAAAREAEPPASSGLPQSSELQNPEADGRELFQRLRAWVRERSHEGQLAESGTKLGANYRTCLFDFLCGFVSKTTVFRHQAQEMVAKLVDLDSWIQGGAADREAVRQLLQEISRSCANEEQEEEQLEDSFETSPASGALVPPVEVLEDPLVDAQEILMQLCAWINAGRRSGRLAEQAAALDERHRQSITAFLLADLVQVAAGPPALPSGSSKMMTFVRQASSKALPKSLASKANSVPKTAPLADTTPDRCYILQALTELGDWFSGEGVTDQSAISRALARTPRAVE